MIFRSSVKVNISPFRLPSCARGDSLFYGESQSVKQPLLKEERHATVKRDQIFNPVKEAH